MLKENKINYTENGKDYDWAKNHDYINYHCCPVNFYL